MKFSCNRATTLAVISFVFLLAATSCKKSSSSGGGSGSITATVGGTAWSTNYTTVGVYASGGGLGLFEIVGLQFKSGDSTSFTLEFAAPITLNQAINADTSALIIAYTDSKSGASYTGMTGGIGTAILTVTSYDSTAHTIGGTFSGSLYNIANFTDSVVVTGGKFNSSYTVN